MTFRRIIIRHQATYDSEADATYLQLADHIDDGAAVRQEVVGIEGVGEVVIDFDLEGRLLGIEVIGAAALLPALLLQQLGIEG